MPNRRTDQPEPVRRHGWLQSQVCSERHPPFERCRAWHDTGFRSPILEGAHRPEIPRCRAQIFALQKEPELPPLSAGGEAGILDQYVRRSL